MHPRRVTICNLKKAYNLTPWIEISWVREHWFLFQQTKHYKGKTQISLAQTSLNGWYCLEIFNHTKVVLIDDKYHMGVTCSPSKRHLITRSWLVAMTDTWSNLSDQGAVCGPWNDRCIRHLHLRSSPCDPIRTSSV